MSTDKVNATLEQLSPGIRRQLAIIASMGYSPDDAVTLDSPSVSKEDFAKLIAMGVLVESTIDTRFTNFGMEVAAACKTALKRSAESFRSP